MTTQTQQAIERLRNAFRRSTGDEVVISFATAIDVLNGVAALSARVEELEKAGTEVGNYTLLHKWNCRIQDGESCSCGLDSAIAALRSALSRDERSEG